MTDDLTTIDPTDEDGPDVGDTEAPEAEDGAVVEIPEEEPEDDE